MSGLFGEAPKQQPLSLFSLPQQPQPQQQIQPQQQYSNTIFTPSTASQQTLPSSSDKQSFQYLQSCYDSSSPSNPFRFFFYNRLPPNTPYPELIKPPQVSDRLWQQVKDDNPRPSAYVPVMATGFSDLEERARWQDGAIAAHSAKLTELEARIKKMLNGYEANMDNGSKARRLLGIVQKQNLIALRVIKIMRQVEVLRRAGRRLSENEVEMMKLLVLLKKKLAAPPIDSSSIRVFAFQLKALQEERDERDGSLILLDDLFMDRVQPILSDQQRILHVLVESINTALTDFDIILHGYLP